MRILSFRNKLYSSLMATFLLTSQHANANDNEKGKLAKTASPIGSAVNAYNELIKKHPGIKPKLAIKGVGPVATGLSLLDAYEKRDYPRLVSEGYGAISETILIRAGIFFAPETLGASIVFTGGALTANQGIKKLIEESGRSVERRFRRNKKPSLSIPPPPFIVRTPREPKLQSQGKEKLSHNDNLQRKNCDNIVFTMPPDMIDFTRNNLNKWKKMRPHSAYTRELKKKSIAELEATLKDFENTKSKKQACLDRNNQLNKEAENDNMNSEEEITTIIPEQKKIEENHTEVKPIEQKTEDNVKRPKPVLKKSPYFHKPGSHRVGKEIKKPKLWNDVTSEDLKKYIELMKK